MLVKPFFFFFVVVFFVVVVCLSLGVCVLICEYFFSLGALIAIGHGHCLQQLATNHTRCIPYLNAKLAINFDKRHRQTVLDHCFRRSETKTISCRHDGYELSDNKICYCRS